MNKKDINGIIPELPMFFHSIYVYYLLIIGVFFNFFRLFSELITLFDNTGGLRVAFENNPYATTLIVLYLLFYLMHILLIFNFYLGLCNFEYKGITLLKWMICSTFLISCFNRFLTALSFDATYFSYVLGSIFGLSLHYIPVSIYYKKRAYLFNPPENLKEKTYMAYMNAVEAYNKRYMNITTKESQETKSDTTYTNTHPDTLNYTNGIQHDSEKSISLHSAIPLISSNTDKPNENRSSTVKIKIKKSGLNTPNKTTSTAPVIKFCRKCGKKIVHDSIYCPNCGVKIFTGEK